MTYVDITPIINITIINVNSTTTTNCIFIFVIHTHTQSSLCSAPKQATWQYTAKQMKAMVRSPCSSLTLILKLNELEQKTADIFLF